MPGVDTTTPNVSVTEVVVPDAGWCSEGEPAADVPQPKPAPKANVFAGEDTGAWSVSGRVVSNGFFFFRMSDTNPFVNGSLLVSMQADEGRSLGLMVRAWGSEQSYDEEFEGPDWEAASTEKRAARVKASIIRYAKLAEGQCGAKLSTLDEEFATFDMAFRVLDRRQP